MKAKNKSIFDNLADFLSRPETRDYSKEEAPIRAELFSADQMERHGRTLAMSHKLVRSTNSNPLLIRLADNERVLAESCQLLTTAVGQNNRISPAGEWLLDNFYLIEEQIRTAKRHLPKGYGRTLPRLSSGLPRVYDIALETISHGAGQWDLESLSRFVASYQKSTPLTVGELWAIPIMLRLALIENLRRVAARVAAGSIERNLAATWAERMAEVVERDPKSLILVTADMARSNPPMTSSFVADFTRHLQGRGTALALPLSWIEQRLFESEQTIEQLVQLDSQQQASNQVSVSNSIGSLRLLAEVDWRKFVETTSVVEDVLREDPANIYCTMDFTTRDRYRHVVERLAKRSGLAEQAIAHKVVELSHLASSTAPDSKRAHIGFFLVGDGLTELEKLIQAKLSLIAKLRRVTHDHPTFWYLGWIFILTLLFSGGLLSEVRSANLSLGLLVGLVAVLLLATSQLSVALVNWIATLMATPHLLPRMDFSKGIPAELRTLVVVPAMLSSPVVIDDLISALEVRFLGNRDQHLHFALLSDFSDAQTETMPEDEMLLLLAKRGISELNQRYVIDGDSDIFFLFHRPRRWNPAQNAWIGFERKRGKLSALNALLRGKALGEFSTIVGDIAVLQDVKYIITLDADTHLPRDSARQFVGVMAHPLNRPRYDETRQRVTEGYGILQPRVAESLSSDGTTRYVQLCGSEPGIDPYTRSVSDVYQDVFDQGSFIGKGIYDLDIFEQALNGRFPDNRILSHDLLEGCYARAGLISDVPLYEEYPSGYLLDVRRRYRWIRGDWQLISWLLPKVPLSDGHSDKNPLSALSQWKLLDNLRRSLVPPSLLALLIMGWSVLPSPVFWLSAVLTIILAPSLIAALVDTARKPNDVLLSQHLVATGRATVMRLTQSLLTLACLPHEAFYSSAAILRTLWRVMFSGKRLLEWTSSAEVGRVRRDDIFTSLRAMWIGPILALLSAAYLSQFQSLALLAAAPLLALWFVSPLLTWWISQPLERNNSNLNHKQTRFLRRIARKTWAFFDTFVGAEDNWVPPDNYQEAPAEVVAHRTSPTNIGMALLANLTAYDFGYISVKRLLERTANTFATLEKLERHRGHFYNWYDTQTLKPLLPRYISSVDSGNLAGHLLTLRPGLLALPEDRLLPARFFEGLSDTVDVLADASSDLVTPELVQFRELLIRASDPANNGLLAVRQLIAELHSGATSIVNHFSTSLDLENIIYIKAMGYSLVKQVEDAASELDTFAPWGVWSQLADVLDDFPELAVMPTLRGIAAFDERFQFRLHENTTALAEMVSQASRNARERIKLISHLALQAGEFALMDYDFLFDDATKLLTVGYNVEERRRDSGNYDLLPSEARLPAFVAIAQGQLPQESWFALGRLLTTVGGEPLLVSWSGSMFEYLMPLLVMPTYDNTLLDQTYKAAVRRQIEYGRQCNVPWGISESGYNAVDQRLNYQYRAFGVPGLGLKRGLSEDLVIAPYATAMALMVAPEAACSNLQRLAAEGVEGRFGFYEAVDYTATRLPRGQSSALIRSFMAHHQGMSLLSLSYLLLDRPMQKRFEADPYFQATMLLLQERAPKEMAFYSHAELQNSASPATDQAEASMRVFDTPNTSTPEVQLLSNSRYHVMVSNAGGGYSRWRDIAVTRWREDGTRDNWGVFCYLRDVASGAFWSTAFQPTVGKAERFEAVFTETRAEFRRREQDIDTYTEIVVSPEDDIELRRTRITNRSKVRRTIEVTSYTEVVLASAASDQLHPAFSNLFVQTEILPQLQAIVCTRRPRAANEHAPWLFHLMAVHGAQSSGISYETDRSKFIGRGNSLAAPRAMLEAGQLSGSDGPVLDPIVAIRRRITLDAGASATIDIILGVVETRDRCLSLVEKYHDRRLADRVFDLAWTHSQVVLRQLNASEADAQLYARLASSIIYASGARRAEPSVLVSNRRGQSGLWGYSISGDLPIVLLRIADSDNVNLVRQMVQAHAYWRLKGLIVDLVILNEDHAGYRQILQDQIMGLIAAGFEVNLADRPGGIFVRSSEQISNEDRILFQTVAHVIISDSRGTLADQVNRRGVIAPSVPRLIPTLSQTVEFVTEAVPPRDLLFFNGLGGFASDGREYVIVTDEGQATPAPWVNVLANAQFGSVISESGQAYTWSENAHEFRLTPWDNDPVSDSAGETFYLRDEETGRYWSPTALPRRGSGEYVTRHGFGYSVFEHTEGGIRSELTVFVALDAAVKFAVLKVENISGRSRQLSATGYVEWVLGDLRSKTGMYVVTEIVPESGALYARNRYNTEFAHRTAFFDVDDENRSVTGDRTEFLGRNGLRRAPVGMKRARLSGKVGASLDPCAAIQVPFELADGRSRQIVFRLGVGHDTNDANALVKRFRGTAAAAAALEAVEQFWQRTLGAVQVETPDPSVNMLANGWLLYQTLSCRIWGRSGYYQSGGAFGFRDQLQDMMALVHTEPQRLREHLLRCAEHQFIEGDVQHWWHPPTGRGVRTHCSDDYLWLPLVTCHYVMATGDLAVLDEQSTFLTGRPVNMDEDSYYDLPIRSEEKADLYEHCVRAILRGLRFGEHGLPLMGTGDWNDGMNLVGAHGKGESIWLGFFLHEVLMRFREVAERRGDSAFVERCTTEAAKLSVNLEQHGWDGEWYRRAYFDDGTSLGSASNAECQIDAIAQSWSVLSGVGDPVRTRQAMNAVNERLVRRDDGLIQLLDPPFNTSSLNPGYIKGYVPGVRENGGQYTHAAIWTTMAFARLGDSERAWELLALINPVNHGKTPEAIATYKVEPYVAAADVYAVAPHIGRGGWTWYTGSAGWMYRLIIESLLGLRLEANTLHIEPCIPAGWAGYKMQYRYRDTVYDIAIVQHQSESGCNTITLDGVEMSNNTIPLEDDKQPHSVQVQLVRSLTT